MLKPSFRIIILATLLIIPLNTVLAANTPEGTAWVDLYGYTGCIELTNGTTTVILEPNCGGRVIEYSIGGKNVLLVDPLQNGWTYSPGKKTISICAGRFDIGPEKTIPSRQKLWLGIWTAEITGSRAARMTSPVDESPGVQLTREFTLDQTTSKLLCTQIIKNISDSTKTYCHWSRTFVEGDGICVVPLSPGSRFPKGYIWYEPASGPRLMNFRPDDHPNITVKDGFFTITGPPPFPKFGLDSMTGWLGYITRSNLLFVKKYETYPDRPYAEMAGLTISIWYYKDQKCELEPIGPSETIEPGESASFTEEWWLFPYEYPGADKLDTSSVNEFVTRSTR